ncbi:hypothetical protein D3C81_498650 [compost metagenome]
MKKFVSGVIVGALLFGGVTAFADDVKSLVGLKVQAETTIAMGDQTLTGIIVDGKTYAPVRAIGESAGYSVTIDGKKVNLKAGEKLSSEELKQKQKQARIDGLNKGIAAGKERVKQYESYVAQAKDKLDKATTDTDKKEAQADLDMCTNQLQQEKEALAQAESQLAELEK